MWCIPPEQDAAFVCQMEQVLEVYKRPHDPAHPVVCMDEQPKQLISERSPSVPMGAGKPGRIDCEYVREGVGNGWIFVEPLAGWRDVAVTASKTAVDWAQPVRGGVDNPRFSDAERITRVCHNLGTPWLRSTKPSSPPKPCGSRKSWNWFTARLLAQPGRV
jgi:hypothetical protein